MHGFTLARQVWFSLLVTALLIAAPTTVVATPSAIDSAERTTEMHPKVAWEFPEILCENVPAEKLVAYLRPRYPDVAFVMHSTLNGFYALGNKDQVLAIRREVPELDQASQLEKLNQASAAQTPSGLRPVIRSKDELQTVTLNNLDLDDVLSRLQDEHPDVLFLPNPLILPTTFTIVAPIEVSRPIRRAITAQDGPARVSPTAVRSYFQVKQGVDLNSLQQTLKEQDGELSLEADPEHQALVLQGEPAVVDRGLQHLYALQMAQPNRPQLMMECKLILASAYVEKALNIAWAPTGLPIETVDSWEDVPSTPESFPEFARPAPDQAHQGWFQRSGLILHSNINFLVTMSDTGVLASPRIAMDQGATGEIRIGDEYRVDSYDPAHHSFVQHPQRLGLDLQITPSPTTDGSFDCTVDTESRLPLGPIPGGLRRRTLHATAKLRDGESVVYEGLCPLDELEHAASIYGDLPILGRLFRSTTVTPVHKRVLLMITLNRMI